MSLQTSYSALCTQLGILDAPSIAYVDALPGNIKGVHWKQHNRIDLLGGMTPDQENLFITHELCHSVLHRAGYHSVGHSWIFLATFHLMLTKAGLTALETVETTATANWNRWAPWPHLHKHIQVANDVVGSFETTHGPLQNCNADEIARCVIDTHVYKLGRPKWALGWSIPEGLLRTSELISQPFVKIGIRVWHDFLGDTRGNLIAVELAAGFIALLGLVLLILGICVSEAPPTFLTVAVCLLVVGVLMVDKASKVLKRR